MKGKQKRGIKPLQVDLPEIALNSPTTIEYLPYPKVHFPNHYGIFITFSSYSEGVHYFCDCAKTSIDNYLILHNLIDTEGLVKADWGFHNAFSNYITKRTQIKVPYDTVFKYKPTLCHKCNLSSPNLRWCHEMYGGSFMQYFGWYVKQTKYKLGINGVDIIEDKCPEDVIELIKSLTTTGTTKIQNNEDGDGYDYYEYKKVKKALDNYAEDITRQEFGFCKIGKGWVSESILFNVIKKLFPSETIIRHDRPKWLNGLEIDIFIPSVSLGFEYQGHQHFYEVGNWGDDSGLKNLQKRDKLKKELCSKNCISLITIDFTEPLIEKYIQAKITAHNSIAASGAG
ncbi:MAG: hypothetical protein ABIO79_05750 [Ferruginibacter sp.]